MRRQLEIACLRYALAAADAFAVVLRAVVAAGHHIATALHTASRRLTTED